MYTIYNMGQRLGQHFLINEEKLKKVADALEINEGDVVIEIGPGHGELTQYLLEAGARVTALERDKALIDPLNKKFASHVIPPTLLVIPAKAGIQSAPAFEVIEGNALELLPMVVEELKQTGKSYKIAGNIPYYITGYLLRVIEGLNHKPTRVVMTIQKEVAERMCATVPHMNLLAASVRFWAEPVIVDIIPKKDFNPPPKVDSATIRLDVRQTEEVKGDAYYAFIKKIFAQPRKTIMNNLAGKEGNKEAIGDLLRSIGVSPDARPQTLNKEQLMALVKLFSSSGVI